MIATTLLHMQDSYLKEMQATVLAVLEEKYVVLDQTCFYPQGGGQLSDIGHLQSSSADRVWQVLSVTKRDGTILHEISCGANELPEVGQMVHGKIDWNRRYRYMRGHTAAHLVSATLFSEVGAKITGNQIAEDKIRIDYDLASYDVQQMKTWLDHTNKIIQQNLVVTTRTMLLEDAKKDPSLFKLAMGFPHELREIRIVSIGDYDIQADGGTHVHSTSEIGTLVFLKAENKGKTNRRLYFNIEP